MMNKHIIPSYMNIKNTCSWALCFGLFFLFSFRPAGLLKFEEKLAGDDASYVSHAFTIGLDFDFDYKNEIANVLNKDRTIASHPIGSGILAAPFVAIGGVLDRANGHQVIKDHKTYHTSWSFFGFLFAVNFYFLAGIWMYWDALRQIYPGYDPRLNVLFSISTGMLQYVLNRFTMSHGFEFFALALVTWSSAQLYLAFLSNRKKLYWYLVCCLGIMLNLFIRVSNINVLILPFILLLIFSISENKSEKSNSIVSIYQIFPKLMVGILLALVPFALFNIHFFHSIYPSMTEMYNYDGKHIDSTTLLQKITFLMSQIPNIPKLLFGSEFGLLYSNPVLFFGMLSSGLFIKSRLSPNYFKTASLLALLILYVGFSLAVVLLWQTTASDYGYRYLFPLYPVALVGMVVWLSKADKMDKSKIAIKVFILCLVFFSIVSQFFYNVNESLSPSPKINAFGVEHSSSANGYHKTVFKNITQMETWGRAIGKSYAGMLASKFIFESSALYAMIPKDIQPKYNRRFRNIPSGVYCQSALLMFLWTAAGMFIGYQQSLYLNKKVSS